MKRTIFLILSTILIGCSRDAPGPIDTSPSIESAVFIEIHRGIYEQFNINHSRELEEDVIDLKVEMDHPLALFHYVSGDYFSLKSSNNDLVTRKRISTGEIGQLTLPFNSLFVHGISQSENYMAFLNSSEPDSMFVFSYLDNSISSFKIEARGNEVFFRGDFLIINNSWHHYIETFDLVNKAIVNRLEFSGSNQALSFLTNDEIHVFRQGNTYEVYDLRNLNLKSSERFNFPFFHFGMREAQTKNGLLAALIRTSGANEFPVIFDLEDWSILKGGSEFFTRYRENWFEQLGNGARLEILQMDYDLDSDEVIILYKRRFEDSQDEEYRLRFLTFSGIDKGDIGLPDRGLIREIHAQYKS